MVTKDKNEVKKQDDNTGSEIWIECWQAYRRNFQLWECDTAAAGEPLDTSRVLARATLLTQMRKVVVMKEWIC